MHICEFRKSKRKPWVLSRYPKWLWFSSFTFSPSNLVSGSLNILQWFPFIYWAEDPPMKMYNRGHFILFAPSPKLTYLLSPLFLNALSFPENPCCFSGFSSHTVLKMPPCLLCLNTYLLRLRSNVTSSGMASLTSPSGVNHLCFSAPIMCFFGLC